MTAEVQGLILGIGGLVSTLASAALGLHFTARARTAPMREVLYSRQLTLAERILRVFGRARVLATMLTADGEHAEQAREDIRVVAKRLSILTDEAAALLPTELYVDVNQATATITSLIVEYDEQRDTRPLLDQFAVQAAKAALMMRVALGVDELSHESIRLFSKSSDLARIASMGVEDFSNLRDKKEPARREE